ncbi:MAG TPA: hypothetical protein VG711_12445 [Phycisphaerales bacterium]|nr:hypothetical protein [Phycisphaerales bacterium]
MAESTMINTNARGIIKDVRGNMVILEVPGTSYEVHLLIDPSSHASELSARKGKRMTGEMNAHGLKIEESHAGGKFIEPLQGAPRIVAGSVIAKDDRRLCVDVSVPMWISLESHQNSGEFEVGQMVNCYVKSGTSIQPRS